MTATRQATPPTLAAPAATGQREEEAPRASGSPAAAVPRIGGRAFLGDVLQFQAPGAAWTEGGSVLAVLGFFGIVPYVTTARFFTYLNMRTRAEGWDIQTRFAAIAARAEHEHAA